MVHCFIYEIKKKYPKQWVVILPAKAKKNAGKVSNWKVLNNVGNYQEAKALFQQYLDDGCKDVCIYNTSEISSEKYAADVARFFRVSLSIAE